MSYRPVVTGRNFLASSFEQQDHFEEIVDCSLGEEHKREKNTLKRLFPTNYISEYLPVRSLKIAFNVKSAQRML